MTGLVTAKSSCDAAGDGTAKASITICGLLVILGVLLVLAVGP